MFKEICKAIESRKIIAFNYDGGSRRVEPYCYGISKNRKKLLRAYQISGFIPDNRDHTSHQFSLDSLPLPSCSES